MVELRDLVIHSQTVLASHYSVYHTCFIQEPNWDPHNTKPVCEMHELCTVDRPQDNALAQSAEQLRKQRTRDIHARSNTNGWLSRTECYVDIWRGTGWRDATRCGRRLTQVQYDPLIWLLGNAQCERQSHLGGYRDTEFLVTNKSRKRVKNVVTSKGIEVGIECK
jgi:hypothetical protein